MPVGGCLGGDHQPCAAVSGNKKEVHAEDLVVVVVVCNSWSVQVVEGGEMGPTCMQFTGLEI